MNRSLSITQFVRLPPETGTAAFDAVASRCLASPQARRWTIRSVFGDLVLDAPRGPGRREARHRPGRRTASGVFRPTRRLPVRAELDLLDYNGVWLRCELRVRTKLLPPRLAHLRAAKHVLESLEQAMEAWVAEGLCAVDLELSQLEARPGPFHSEPHETS